MTRIPVWLAVMALCCTWLAPAAAVEPDEILKDKGLEARARTISAELRCLVCQNQSIDDSSAPLARDLRLIVRERLVAGDSDNEIYDFVVARYGEFVLLRPRFNAANAALWLGPLLLLGVTVLLIGWRLRQRRTATGVAPVTPPLSRDEQRRLDELLADEPSGREP